MPAIAAILYDHDGTLVDSLGIVVAATNRVLTDRGLPECPGPSIIAAMVHATAPRMGLHAGISDAATQRTMAAEFYRAAHAVGPGQARVYAGIVELLAANAAVGLRQGVVSNNQGTLIRQLLAHLGLAGHLDVTLGEEDMPAPKPDPRGVLLAAQRLGVDPSGCVYVGDTPGDWHTAQAAGMACIGVTWGITPRHEMLRHGFAAVVDHPREIVALLGAMSATKSAAER